MWLNCGLRCVTVFFSLDTMCPTSSCGRLQHIKPQRGASSAAGVQDLAALMRDVLLTARLDDHARFKQMVLETRSALETGIVGAGHRAAMERLAAQRTVAGWVDEQTGGLEYLWFIRDLAKRVDSDWDAIKGDLEELRRCILATEVRRARADAIAVCAK